MTCSPLVSGSTRNIPSWSMVNCSGHAMGGSRSRRGGLDTLEDRETLADTGGVCLAASGPLGVELAPCNGPRDEEGIRSRKVVLTRA